MVANDTPNKNFALNTLSTDFYAKFSIKLNWMNQNEFLFICVFVPLNAWSRLLGPSYIIIFRRYFFALVQVQVGNVDPDF
jgi:hypothetical protein